MTAIVDGLTELDGSGGSELRGALLRLREWFARFVLTTDELDIDLLALWAAHTYVALETYTTPRLVIDSTMFGSGKTTVLEHLGRLCFRPVQAASLSSPALLTRMLHKEQRTILIDEVDRSLDPKKPGVDELIAVLNSGYKRGATRPVLVPGKAGDWDVAEMTTFAPVAMAGNAPHLPDDTRSRSIRVLLTPDLFGRVESTDWEEIEPDAQYLAEALAQAMDNARELIRVSRPQLPDGCTGRMKEKWGPLARVAAVAGGPWPAIAVDLIRRDLHEVAIEREEGLLNRPAAVVLLDDLRTVWPVDETFQTSSVLIERLARENSDYWGEASGYGKRLTAQRMGRLLVQVGKLQSSKNANGVRGYDRSRFLPVWRSLGIEPLKPSDSVKPASGVSA